MGSTNYLSKSKAYKPRSASSIGSDKELGGKLKARTKIRRPAKMNDYGMKRIPDYTELAYKEAVGKLRYFLSGNYSPSVRSYGASPTIKNLDETDDGDLLDKKYPTSLGVNLDYKPRPRLTTKYATLYADSLKNYTPPTNSHRAPPPAPAASDLSGGTNPDVVHFIQKQEEYIEQLERESQYCRDELNNLLGKVKEVISENENLHEAQKNRLISRMFHTTGSETDELDELGDSTGLDSDNKISPSKARRSASKSRPVKLEGPNIVFESRIAELEAQLTQSKIDLKKVQEENNENKRKLASGLVDSTCLDGFKRQIDNLQRDKSSLEGQISKLKLSLESREGDFEGRYKRGSDAIEHQLREERNNLEAELRRLKDDLAKERSKTRELAGEGARRAVQERSAAEQRYNAHFDELSHDLAAQYDNVSKLQLELERQRRDDNDLKREISMKNAAIEELKMELKNKTATLQADLSQAHAEKASLDEELASAHLAIERHQRQSKHETNRLNSEIQSLRQRLDRADADLVHSRRENLRLSEQIATLEKELNMKNLTPMSPEKNKKEKELSTMLESMENKHAQTVADLEAMIHSQNSLMEKLTGECRGLTDKLDDASRRHKEELATLHRQVDLLGRSMQQANAPGTLYQAQPAHQSPTNQHDNYPAPEPRPEYSRVDSARHAPVSRQPSVADLGEHRLNSNNQSRALSRQTSRNSIKLENTLPQETQNKNTHEEPQLDLKTYDVTQQDVPEKDTGAENVGYNATVVDSTMDAEPTQQYEQNYDQNQTEYAHDQTYDPNYAEQYQGNSEYQTQPGYDQNYDPQAYPEGQYQQETYEQYPEQQQFTDPNAQYEGQYENYATDPNDQPQNYEQQEYNTGNQELPMQPVEDVKPDASEAKRSNSPNEKVTNQR